jgi:hypothetical protein
MRAPWTYIRQRMTSTPKVLLALVVALPLFADEPQKTDTTTPAQTTTVEQAAPAPVVDSPMVAAAKRTKRGKKPGIVITNETLKQAGGNAHVTTTTNPQAPLAHLTAEPLRPTPEMIAKKNEEGRKQAEAAKAARAKKVEDEKKQRELATKYADEQDSYDDEEVDPRLLNRPEEEKPPQQ